MRSAPRPVVLRAATSVLRPDAPVAVQPYRPGLEVDRRSAVAVVLPVVPLPLLLLDHGGAAGLEHVDEVAERAGGRGPGGAGTPGASAVEHAARDHSVEGDQEQRAAGDPGHDVHRPSVPELSGASRTCVRRRRATLTTVEPRRVPLHHPARTPAIALSVALAVGAVLALAGVLAHVRPLTVTGVLVLVGCVVVTRAWYLRRGRGD